MNLQGVTNAVWSFYLLKYEIKCEPLGTLKFKIEDAQTLELENLTEVQLKLVSEAILSWSACATQATLICLKINIIIALIPWSSLIIHHRIKILELSQA